MFDNIAKGTEVYIIMNSGAVYRGIFQWYKDAGGGSIQLTDVKCCERGNFANWVVAPKKGMNRVFWVSKIKEVSYESVH